MSRPLRFRIWDSRLNNFWCPMKDTLASLPPGTQVNGDCMPYTLTLDGVPIRADGTNVIPDGVEFVVEQFTGLKDKIGRDIYEGDMVELFGEGCEAPPCYRHVGIVMWNPETLGYSVEGHEIGGDPDDGGIPALRASGYVVTLLGNLHENPGLLA